MTPLFETSALAFDVMPVKNRHVQSRIGNGDNKSRKSLMIDNLRHRLVLGKAARRHPCGSRSNSCGLRLTCPQRTGDILALDIGCPQVTLVDMCHRKLSDRLPCEWTQLLKKLCLGIFDADSFQERLQEKWDPINIATLHHEKATSEVISITEIDKNESGCRLSPVEEPDFPHDAAGLRRGVDAPSTEPFDPSLVTDADSSLKISLDEHSSEISIIGTQNEMQGNPEPEPLKCTLNGSRQLDTLPQSLETCFTSNQLGVFDLDSSDDDAESDDDGYWSWNPERQKFEHWDDEEGQMVYCPDEFD